MSDAFKSGDSVPPRPVSPETEGSDYVAGEDFRFAAQGVQSSTPLDEARARAQLEVERLQDEIFLLRERLAAIRARAKGVVSAEGASLNASAHAQLGDYPWLKLGAASVASYALGKVLHKVPFGLLTALLIGRPRHLK
ncbi:hypothetical protein [Rhizobium tubonense]|uniref:Uncharacterized protein n=1 Tax=Rhizobium tubonense TaxID=484088 RepID=A0A2W4CTL9_9HYPH|nr:hypothetical protein [Rhizobium tubonense]PZM13705.1 hypothetical protein CPY51_12520 [Rhizobium tubonense]